MRRTVMLCFCMRYFSCWARSSCLILLSFSKSRLRVSSRTFFSYCSWWSRTNVSESSTTPASGAARCGHTYIAREAGVALGILEGLLEGPVEVDRLEGLLLAAQHVGEGLVEIGGGDLDAAEGSKQVGGVEAVDVEILGPHTLPLVLGLLELLAHEVELGREGEVALVVAAHLHGEATDKSRVDLQREECKPRRSRVCVVFHT